MSKDSVKVSKWDAKVKSRLKRKCGCKSQGNEETESMLKAVPKNGHLEQLMNLSEKAKYK